MKKLWIISLIPSLLISCFFFRSENILKVDNFPLSLLWSYEGQDSINKLAIADEWIAVSSDNEIAAFEAKTGLLLWKFTSSLEPASELIFSGNYLVITNIMENQILGVTKSGEVEKRITLDQGGRFQVLAAFSSYIFIKRIPSWEIEVYHLDAGTKIWSVIVDRGDVRLNFDPNSNIVFVTTSNFVSAHNVFTGDVIWKINNRETQAGFLGTELLYFYSEPRVNQEGTIIAIDPKSAKVAWETVSPISNMTTVYNFALFENQLLASTNFGLISLNKKDGEVNWSSETPDFIYGKPVFIDNTLYVRGTNTDTIYAIDPRTGQYVGFLNLGEHFLPSLSQMTIEILYKYDDILIFPFSNMIYAYQKSNTPYP